MDSVHANPLRERRPAFVPLTATLLLICCTGVASGQVALDKIFSDNKDAIVFLRTKVTLPTGEIKESTGTGFLLNAEGYVLTASHVLSPEGSYDKSEVYGTVKTRYGYAWPMDVIEDNSPRDLLLLKFKNVDIVWSAVSLGAPTRTPAGAKLFTLGYPLTEDLAPNEGVLRNKNGPGGSWTTTVPLNRGDSGAPVFDDKGHVVAIVVSGLPEARGIAYCLPLNYAQPLLSIAGVTLATELPAPRPPRPSLLSPADRATLQLSCSTEKESFDVSDNLSRASGSVGSHGYYGSAFRSTIRTPYAFYKKCLHCGVKGVAFTISATIWGDKAATRGLYLLDMSEVRSEWFSFEAEPGGRVSLKHYRDGRDTGILWAGAHVLQEKSRLTLEAKDGNLIASVNSAEIGRASYDPKLVPNMPLGSGFFVAAGTQVPASAWFDDYEFTACLPDTEAIENKRIQNDGQFQGRLDLDSFCKSQFGDSFRALPGASPRCASSNDVRETSFKEACTWQFGSDRFIVRVDPAIVLCDTSQRMDPPCANGQRFCGRDNKYCCPNPQR